ncbi:hypothetical protein BHE74_00055120 [Ensete ventricosum]|nr:hypothetical protein BHE74_00055120 [Ensete ventricosum]
MASSSGTKVGVEGWFPQSMTSRAPTYHLMTRPGYGAEGRRIRLVANHFDVKLTKTDAVFYQYTLTITPDDVRGYKAAQNKVYGRKIVNKLYEIYSKELNNKRFAYDGDGSTVGGDLKRSKRSGPWKRKNLYQFGIVTQCIAPPKSLKDQYLANVLLKINSKIRKMKKTNNFFLFGDIRDLLLDFYKTNGGMKPAQMIIFRYSFPLFLKIIHTLTTVSINCHVFFFCSSELLSLFQVFEHLGDTTMPKFTVIVAQKKHHTRFFIADNSDNVPPGTVVDNTVVHPRNYDFYMCAHQGRLVSALFHVFMSYVGDAELVLLLMILFFFSNQKGNAAVSMGKTASLSLLAFCLPPSSPPPDDVECSFPSSVAPVCYAHLAARQLSQCFDLSDTSGGDLPNKAGVPHLPELHENVRRSMFFC